MKTITRLYKASFLLGISLCFTACGGGSNGSGGGSTIANLSIDTIVANDNSGRVQFILEAPDAEGYRLVPGEDLETLESADGMFEYTYEVSGEYAVNAFADLAGGEVIQRSMSVSVQVGDDAVVAGNVVPTTGYTAPTSYDGLTLTWSDEFDGDALNEEDWNFELGNIDPFGNIGWGNNELQNYATDNVSVSNGYLTIEARREANNTFTSGRINTRDKQTFQYGRIDIRAALPNQRGMWPALWMLGEDHLQVGWPICGEIDIAEAFITGPDTADEIKSNAFWGSSFPAFNAPSPALELASGDFSDEWHVFSLEWDVNNLIYLVDGVEHYRLFINDELGEQFRDPFFFLMNVAVGGNPVVPPDSTTEFPQRMFVDYVRVYQ